MQDLPKEAQRIVITAAPERAADLVERYARRALTLGAGDRRRSPSRRPGPDRRRILGTASIARWRTWWSCSTRRRSSCGRRIAVSIRRSLEPVAVADPEMRLVTGDAPQAAR